MLEISIRRFESLAILDLSGSIDIDSANLIEKIGWCLDNGYKEILCNFENINLVDYAGLSVLTIAYKDIINRKGRIKFCLIPEHIKRNLCLVYLDRIFEIYEDEDSALRSFEEDRNISDIQRKQLRRRFRRLDLDIDIEFKSKSRAEEFSKGKVLNISAVGLLVFADKTYPLGEILNARLLLSPKPELLEFDAQVVWLVQKEIQPQIYPAMGLEFHNIESLMQKKIAEFVDRNLPLCSTTE